MLSRRAAQRAAKIEKWFGIGSPPKTATSSLTKPEDFSLAFCLGAEIIPDPLSWSPQCFGTSPTSR